MALGMVLAVAAPLGFLVLAQSALTLLAVASLSRAGSNRAVEFFRRRRVGRGLVVATVYVVVVIIFAVLAVVFITPLAPQINHFIKALAGLVANLTRGA